MLTETLLTITNILLNARMEDRRHVTLDTYPI